MTKFNPFVTPATECNEVVELVCQPAILVLAGDVAEGFERNDVVNIQRDTSLRSATRLTAIPVALARQSPLSLPQRPVPGPCTTLPLPVGITDVVDRQPVARAPQITELMLELAKLIALAGKGLAARIARHGGRRATFVHPMALSAAKVVRAASDSLRRALEVSTAHRARQGNGLETGRQRTGQCPVIGGHTRAVTEVAITCLELVRVAFDLLSTVGARNGRLTGFGGHSKPPVGGTDALAEGAPVANRRLQHHIKLPAIRQRQVRPQHQRVYHGLGVRGRGEAIA